MQQHAMVHGLFMLQPFSAYLVLLSDLEARGVKGAELWGVAQRFQS